MATQKPRPKYQTEQPATPLNWDALDSFLNEPPPAVAPESSSMVRRAFGDTGVSLVKGAIGVPEAMVGMADLVTGGYAGKAAESLGFRPKEAKAALDELYSPEQQAANREVQQAQGFVDTTMAALRNPSTIIHGAIESAPSLLPAGAVARGARVLAPRLSGAAAAGLGEGAVSAGQTAEQVRQETADGLLTGGQSALAAGSGGLTGIIGAVAGKVANARGFGDINQLVAGVQNAGPQAQKALTRKLLEGFATEGVLQELPQSAQEQIAQNVALGKPWDEGVGNAAAMGALAGGLMGGAAAPFGHGAGPVVDPAASPALLPDTGPMSRAVNAATVAARGTPLDFTPTEIPGKGDGLAVQDPPDTTALDFEADPRYASSIAFPNGKAPEQPLFPSKQLADIHIGEQGAFGELQAVEAGGGQWAVVQTPEAANRNARANIEMWMERAQPMEEAQAKDMAKRAESELNKPMTALPMPDGEGWTVVPRQWVTAPVLLEYTERAAAAQQAREAPVERAPRTGSTDGVEIDPAAPNAVARYIAEQAATNTPAARAFVQDYRAGRITDADVLALIAPKPAAEPTPDERLAAAAEAGKVETVSTDGLILNREGKPFKTEMAASREQKKQEGRQIIVVEGGYAVRPAATATQEAPAAAPAEAAQAPAVEPVATAAEEAAPAAQPAPAPAQPKGKKQAVEAVKLQRGDWVSYPVDSDGNREVGEIVGMSGDKVTVAMDSGARTQVKRSDAIYVSKVTGAPAQQPAQAPQPAPKAEPKTKAKAKSGGVPKSFRKKVKVTTQVFMEDTGTFAEQEVDADTALEALNADIDALVAFRACIAGG